MSCSHPDILYINIYIIYDLYWFNSFHFILLLLLISSLFLFCSRHLIHRPSFFLFYIFIWNYQNLMSLYLLKSVYRFKRDNSNEKQCKIKVKGVWLNECFYYLGKLQSTKCSWVLVYVFTRWLQIYAYNTIQLLILQVSYKQDLSYKTIPSTPTAITIHVS